MADAAPENIATAMASTTWQLRAIEAARWQHMIILAYPNDGRDQARRGLRNSGHWHRITVHVMEVSMRKPGILLAACGTALALFALGAQAVTCDIVIDRTGAVVYQDVVPPVDMSVRGAAARDQMRQRGEQLMIIEASQCPKLVFSTVTGSAGVDEIVAGMRPYVG
ncbi:MAG TPA: hypothetical protein VIK97_13990, partial [Casimicrobiaceae bacterium]